MQEDISIWGLIDRPISVTEASILWCDMHPPEYFSPAKAENWVTDPKEYNRIFPRIAKFFKHREDPLKISLLLENAILKEELPADKWDCPTQCVYEYSNFNNDLTTVLIEDLAKWANDNCLSPRFLQSPMAKFNTTKKKNSSKKEEPYLKPHEFIKETFYELVNSSNNKFPTYKKVIEKMLDISEAEEFGQLGENYNGMIILDAPSEDLWGGSVDITFAHSTKGGETELSTKTIRNYLTTLRKEYNNNL